ncbi:MAG: lipocalin-like domain-containing protein [Elusimicrobia bacterium]|nr:lipocalin-like domain-containing protein [Elusimicrobiota bacterium]
MRGKKATHPLVGTWRLASCSHRLADGSRWYPFGRRPAGRLVYTPEGFMMVILMAKGRAPARSGQVFEASEKERSEAAAGFLAYSGRCELGDRGVVHHVDLSLFPNWVGTAQLRSYRLSGDRVTFWTRSFRVGGKRQVASLSWRREIA